MPQDEAGQADGQLRAGFMFQSSLVWDPILGEDQQTPVVLGL